MSRSLPTYADNQIDALCLHAFRQGRQALYGDIFCIDIGQSPGVYLEQMMMGPGIGIVENLAGIDDHFSNQSFFQKQIERVVYRGFGGFRVAVVDRVHHLIGGQVFLFGEQGVGNLNPLVGGIDVMAAQQLRHIVPGILHI